MTATTITAAQTLKTRCSWCGRSQAHVANRATVGDSTRAASGSIAAAAPSSAMATPTPRTTITTPATTVTILATTITTLATTPAPSSQAASSARSFLEQRLPLQTTTTRIATTIAQTTTTMAIEWDGRTRTTAGRTSQCIGAN